MTLVRRLASFLIGREKQTWCARRYLRSTSWCRKPDDSDEIGSQADDVDMLRDNDLKEILPAKDQDYFSPFHGHRVFVMQPDMKRVNRTTKCITTPQHKLDEACALVECLPNWTVAKKSIHVISSRKSDTLFGKGSFETNKQLVRQQKGVSAVFFSIDILTGAQLSTLQKAWKVPVYDRFTIVLMIFKLRAQTREAKLQVALAEIPYFRSRVFGVSLGTLTAQRSDSSVFTSGGATFIDTRRKMLSERERKIKKALEKIKMDREMLRSSRRRVGWPVIAVVGYTNAGKTSLIKALTSDERMVPKDQLFATLDVTTHAGRLCNSMKVLYTDTVGFIADIPTGLIASFSATLEDALNADLIVHVRDISHPDREGQRMNVHETLSRLHLPKHLQENVIEVANKADKLHEDELKEAITDDCIVTSVKSGLGIDILMQEISARIISTTDRLVKCFRIPMSGQHYSWLHKHATIESSRTCDRSSEFLLVDVIISHEKYAQFLKLFGTPKRTKSLTKTEARKIS